MARVRPPKVKKGDKLTLKVIVRDKVKERFKTENVKEAADFYSKRYEAGIFCRVWINNKKLTIAEADLLLLHKRSPIVNTGIYWKNKKGGVMQ